MAACTYTAARSAAPSSKNKVFFFASAERTRQRTDAGNALSNSGANGLRSLPTMAMRDGNFAGTGTVLYDPRTGAANGTGRVPFAFANCPGVTSTTDPRFDSCNYIPASRINPISRNLLSKLVAPTLPGFTNNYFATNSYDTDYNKYDGKITWTPSARVNINGRLGYADSYEDSAPELPSVDGSINPIFQGRIWDSTVHSHSLAVTSTSAPTMVVDGVFGFTRTDMLAKPAHRRLLGRDAGHQEQLPAAAIARHGDSDGECVRHLPAGRRRRAARLPRPAVERVDEFRMDQGRPQREVRWRVQAPPSEPLRDPDAVVYVHRRAHRAVPGGRRTTSTHLRTSCWAR